MAQMKNFDQAFIFMDTVVDQDWAVNQFADLPTFSDSAAHAWKANQQFNVVEEGIAKAIGSFDIVLGYMAENDVEIV